MSTPGDSHGELFTTERGFCLICKNQHPAPGREHVVYGSETYQRGEHFTCRPKQRRSEVQESADEQWGFIESVNGKRAHPPTTPRCDVCKTGAAVVYLCDGCLNKERRSLDAQPAKGQHVMVRGVVTHAGTESSRVIFAKPPGGKPEALEISNEDIAAPCRPEAQREADGVCTGCGAVASVNPYSCSGVSMRLCEKCAPGGGE